MPGWPSASVAPAVEVQVDEALLRDVTEMFRVNGVAVRAQRGRNAGRVAAEAVERDTDQLARAEEVVRRDVRGLTALAVRNTADAAAAAAAAGRPTTRASASPRWCRAIRPTW